jgi:hypothetical protein
MSNGEKAGRVAHVFGVQLQNKFVTPTFYENRKICATRSAYKKCISNCSSYEKLSKINIV